MREDDGNPDAHGVSEVIVTNGTLTALGNGIVELSTGGGWRRNRSSRSNRSNGSCFFNSF
jgi:hypothetical protein